MFRPKLALAALLLSTAVVGCGKKESRAPISDESRQIFAQRCAMCHGASGRGDGASATALNPRPRDLGDPAWQGSVTDDHLKKVIVGGGSAVGKSPLMPPNPDLEKKTEVVDGLVSIVRGFKR